jgi:hypothetical protein
MVGTGMHIGYWWEGQKESRSRCKQVDNTKMELRQIGNGDMD